MSEAHALDPKPAVCAEAPVLTSAMCSPQTLSETHLLYRCPPVLGPVLARWVMVRAIAMRTLGMRAVLQWSPLGHDLWHDEFSATDYLRQTRLFRRTVGHKASGRISRFTDELRATLEAACPGRLDRFTVELRNFSFFPHGGKGFHTHSYKGGGFVEYTVLLAQYGPSSLVPGEDSVTDEDERALVHWIAVPQHIVTAHEGIAWSFALSDADYRPTAES